MHLMNDTFPQSYNYYVYTCSSSLQYIDQECAVCLSCSFSHAQYLGKTHNYWHGAALLLEERVLSEQEASPVKQVPSYDGNYGDQILDPFQQVSLFVFKNVYVVYRISF